jgi:hypothetical protein
VAFLFARVFAPADGRWEEDSDGDRAETGDEQRRRTTQPASSRMTPEPWAGRQVETISDDTAIPMPTPPKCTDCTCTLPAAIPCFRTIPEVKISVKALAMPARNRMMENRTSDDVSPMASSSTAVAASAT